MNCFTCEQENPTFIFIDGSYFNFYRYHSLLTWWKNAFPELLDEIKDPFQNAQFVEKFRKTFVEHIGKIAKNLKLDKHVVPIILVGKDCKRENIWRMKLFPDYKGTRDNSPESGFMGGPFFKMVYDDNLFIKGGAKYILQHPHLEADDCIAVSVKQVLQLHPTASIYIITSDKDYLQIAEPRVQLYNLAYKKLTDQKSSTGNPLCDLFCKIVTGDPSDNIASVFPKCGIKTALKYFENPQLFQTKLNSSEEFKKRYELNSKIIDFNNIPQELVVEFLHSLE
jgi:5'-3' exonuclease